METEKLLLNSEASQEFDFNILRPAESKCSSRKSSKAGVISIINSENNGKRISLSKELMQRLNCPKTVQFSFFDDGIAIAEDLPDNEFSFTIKEWKEKYLIYSTQLVNEITEAFDLNFNGITSQTFHKVQYSTFEETPVALISIK